MLVLSRRTGESLIIDDLLRLTVAVVGRDFVDLALQDIDGMAVGRITLSIDQLRPVVPGVEGLMIPTLDKDRVRLGPECREGIAIVRSEHWKSM